MASSPGETQPAPLPPKEFVEAVGGGDFVAIGEHLAELVKTRTQLKPDQSLLDIGSGCGRLAVPLTRYLSPHARYEGFDVVHPMVRWCQDNITPRFRNFTFQHANLSNTGYRREGMSADQYRFPYEDRAFDVIVATSVFTHLIPESAAQYLRECARVLRPGGRALLTWFLMAEDYEKARQAGKAQMNFAHRWRNCWVTKPNQPEVAICYDRGNAMTLALESGLTLLAVSRGAWIGGNGWTWQDCILASA